MQKKDKQHFGIKSQTKDRADIPKQYTWDLTHIFSNDNAWESAREELDKRKGEILKFKGKLISSAQILLECLKLNDELGLLFEKLYSYASMHSDQDTANSQYRSMRDSAAQLGTELEALAAFIEPELVCLDEKTVNHFIEETPGLDIYRFYLTDLLRRKKHTLSEPEEKILANAGMIAEGPYEIFTVFINAEMPWPDAVLRDGSKIYLDQAGYAKFRALQNRADRDIVFKTFWGAVSRFQNTFGAKLYTQIKKDIFFARSRNYKTSLHAALDSDHIPVEVYYSLIENVSNNLQFFHRYLNIRKRMLSVDTLKYHDLYAPVVKNIDLEYKIDEAWAIIIESMKPMGETYAEVLKHARAQRWIDVYPTRGKKSGAYSSDGGYDVHPYMLLNYNEKYNDVSTLTHEIGHSLHTYYSNKSQPYALAGYSIFTAEVASTFNEALLTEYMLNICTDEDTRLSLLMEYLDGIKGTVFRQTLFAEFEWIIHQTVENGQPLNGDLLTDLYSEMLKKYYGHASGICEIEDHVLCEWCYIPHFYYDFYVYQYATSFTASTSLAQRVINNEKGAAENMIAFLSAGGSDYPIEILKKAGVDMTTTAPFKETMNRMNRVMDEIEKILDNKNII